MKAQMKTSMDSSMDNWQAKSDMRTLIEAQVIRNDKTRFKAAQAEAKKQSDALEEAFEPEGADSPAKEKAEKK